jgi:hypothetical protein
MKIDVVELLNSETWILGTGDEKAAAITLWLASWHQVPAGSLPNNDKMLAHLSQAGKAWRKARAHALRGWVECSDGRLYHPLVSETVRAAWERKQQHRARSQKGNDARWGKNQQVFSDDHNPATIPDTSRTSIINGQPTDIIDADPSLKDALGIAQGSPNDPKGEGEVQGEGEVHREASKQESAGFDSIAEGLEPPYNLPGVTVDPNDGRPVVRARRGWGRYLDSAWQMVRVAGHLQEFKGNLQPLVTWLSAAIEIETIVAAVSRCAARTNYRPPPTLSFFDPAVREEHRMVGETV